MIFEDIIRSRKDYLFTNKALFWLFIPLVVEQALEFFVGFADSVMVASLGEIAISGVSLVDFLMQLLIFGFSALATGGAVIAGQYLGDKQIKLACESSDQLIWFSAILSVIMMVAVLIFREFLINTLFGQVEMEVWNIANLYLMIVATSIPFIAIYNAGAAIFRTTGDSYLPMKIMFFCDIINIIGNAVCIYYLHTGVEGVAIPTVLSRLIACVVILYLIVDERYMLHIKKTLRYRFNWKILKSVLNVGIPYGVENGMFQLGRILVLSLVSTFGTIAIAANSVGLAIAVFQVLPGFGINLGMAVVISRCVGANRFDQAKYYTKKILFIVYVSHFIVNILIVVLLPMLLGIYQLSSATSSLAAELIIWHGVFSVTIWPIAFTLPGTFRGAGDAKFPMYVSVSVMFICRIGFAYLLTWYCHTDVLGTWIAMFIDWFVRSGFYVYRYFSGKWKEYRAIDNSLI